VFLEEARPALAEKDPGAQLGEFMNLMRRRYPRTSEDMTGIAQRAKGLRAALLEKYREFSGRMAVVGHFQILHTLTAAGHNQAGEAEGGLELLNCVATEYRLC
jgi:hypothetical protein